MSNFIAQNEFLGHLENKINSLYGLESVFSLICLQVGFVETTRYSPREALGVLSTAIGRAIVKEGEYYAFFDNKFYILTRVESKKVINDFTKALAMKINSVFGTDLYLLAGFSQYPYDSLNSTALFEIIVSNMAVVDVKRYDSATGTVTDQNPNQQLGSEIVHYLQQMKTYSDILYKHSLIVAKVSLELAKAMNFANQAIKNIVVAAILHDLGYTMISKDVFLGSKQVKAKNSTTIKLHPFLASRKILAENVIFRNVLDLIEQHHEYMDGGGYPLGLSRDNLMMESQIICIADTYALIKEQPHLSSDNIIEFFSARAGFRWDAELIDTFVGLLANPQKREELSREDVSLKDLFNLT